MVLASPASFVGVSPVDLGIDMGTEHVQADASDSDSVWECRDGQRS